MDEKRKLQYKLKKLVKELSNVRARHTELISVYVPAGYAIYNITNQIATEAGTARNIKSTSTRKNVEAALDKMLQHLRTFKQTPKNGIALFSGNVSEREGIMDMKIWSIEPPEALKVKIYRCDQVFFLEPLQEQLEARTTYGLVVMDRREADIALLRGKTIIPLVSLKSMVPGKFAAGGQSANRLHRVVENMAKDFYKKVGDHINEEFSKLKELQGIIIGGPGPTKETLVDGGFISTPLKQKIIGIKHLGYTGDFGLNELVDKSDDILEKEELTRERQAVDKFFQLLSTRPNIVAYGAEEVKKAVEASAVEVLFVSEEQDEKITEPLIDAVDEVGGQVFIVSKETRHGEQINGLGGVAAVLRFALQ